jgi:hypothetical protein
MGEAIVIMNFATRKKALAEVNVLDVFHSPSF